MNRLISIFAVALLAPLACLADVTGLTTPGGGVVATAAPTVSGCGTIATSSASVVAGNTYTGSFVCATGASPATITLTIPLKSVNGWNCNFEDRTSNTHLAGTTGGSLTTDIVKGVITTGDTVTFTCTPR